MTVLLGSILLAMTAGMALGNPQVGTYLNGWSFTAERVCIVVSETDLTVDAQYKFHRFDDADELVVRYPFPADTSLGRPELLSASVHAPEGDEAPLEVVVRDDAWRWILSPSWGESVIVRVEYRQTISARRATYVLTSTRDWDRPLSKATFEIRTPLRTRASVSLPARMTEESNSRVYRAEFVNWMPVSDLVVSLK